MKQHNTRTTYKRTYTLTEELMADSKKPMPAERSKHQITAMWSSLAALETAPIARPDDWRIVSDAVNLMETFCKVRDWRDCDGDLVEITDKSGLLTDAVTAMSAAGERAMAGKPLRLSGQGIVAVRAVLEDYRDIIASLPERAVIQCHRKTEKRLLDILAGRTLPHDVRVVAV